MVVARVEPDLVRPARACDRASDQAVRRQVEDLAPSAARSERRVVRAEGQP